MPFELKWEKRKLQEDNPTEETIEKDHSVMKDSTLGMSREDSPIRKWAIAGAIAAGGVAAYKAGFLRDGIKKAIEYAGEYKPFIANARRGAEQWAKKEHWDDVENVIHPQLSLLRKKVKSPAHKAALKKGESWPEENIGIGRLLKDSDFRRKVFSDTLKDVSDLRSIVSEKTAQTLKETAKDAPKALSTNTDMTKKLRSIAKTQQELSLLGHEKYQSQVKSTMIEEFIRSSTQTAEQGKLAINRTGYRNLTLGDVFELDKDKKLRFKLDQVNKWDVKDRSFHEKTMSIKNSDKQFHRLMDTLMNTEIPVNEGFKKVKETDQWKNIKIDSNLFIGETGKVVDTRGAAKEINEFVRSASMNYQIPIIGINPLRMLGVGNNVYKKEAFGLLGAETVNPMVTKQAGHNATIGETFGRAPLFFAGDKVFQAGEVVQKIGENFEFNDMGRMGKRMYGMTQQLNSLHSIAELNYQHHVEFRKEDGILKNTWGKVGRTLDIGRQDRLGHGGFEAEGISKFLSPDYYVDNFFEKVGSKLKTSKATLDNFEKPGMTTKPKAINVYGYTPEEVRHFVAVKKSYKLSDALNPKSDTTFEDFAKQFVAGRTKDGTMEDHVTSLTLSVFDTINRASQSLAPFGLDLSVHSKRNVMDLTKNLVLKRALPVYMGYQSYEYLNYLTESDPDGDGNPDNITKKMARAVKDIDMGLHVFKDMTGITQLQKDLSPLFQGIEQTPLGVISSDSAEERLDWYENGVVEVRKGRWWPTGNTPFTGGKIEYFQPNWYRRTMADVRFSDSLYGSREEYFKNAWFPTPTHPFAPIRHFITDRYHYDKKHEQDRPYLLSSGLFSNVPFFGPTLDATVGRVMKPRIKMHKEAWEQIPTSSSEFLRQQQQEMQAEIDFAMGSSAGQAETQSWNLETNAMPSGNPVQTFPSALSGQTGTLNRKELPQETEVINTYITPSGGVSVVGMQAGEDLEALNQNLTKLSLNKLAYNNARVDASGVQKLEKFEPTISPLNFNLLATETFSQVTNLQGMKGFLLSGMVTGPLDLDNKVIETSDYAYGIGRGFWDANIGGAGAGLMEIARRFIPSRRKDVEWINPIRNTMPEWLPGEEYFTNFKVGDPYTKVAKGEMRLPGEGYERLHGIDLTHFKLVEDQQLGTSPEEIAQSIIYGSSSSSLENKEAISMAKHFLREVYPVLASDENYEDKERGVKGTIDFLVEDNASVTGQSLINVQAVDNQTFQQIEHGLTPLMTDRLAVNTQKHMMGQQDSNGYVFYVNQEDPTQTRMIQVGYDESEVLSALESVKQAKAYIRQGLADGSINRGELYSPVDKLRILADVAPYSDSYRKQKMIVSAMDLDEETKQEVQAINSRVSEQKEPYRITPYKFKTANVKTETVTIIKSLGNDKFLTLEHRNNPIKLAGINIKNKEGWDQVTTADVIGDYIKPGRRVQISYDDDPGEMYANDSLKTIRASVSYHGKNINRALVEDGVAEFNEDDDSPAAIHARFTAPERLVGSAWESFAHLHTPLHTKFLQVRSGLEAYKRREVYGKDFQRWTNPIQDFLQPLVRENVERSVIPGVIMGAFLGSLFGAKGNPYGKMMGASIGVGTYLVGKSIVSTKEFITKEKWIPKVREKERELEEYIDKLKYIKNKRLYEHYKELALKESKFDVEAYLQENKEEGSKRKNKIRKLEAKKKNLKLQMNQKPLTIFGQHVDLDELREAEVKKLTQKINVLKSSRKVERLPDSAIKAIYYYNQSEKTMYGYDSGEPLTNLLAALPKRDRQYMKYFIDAPEEERAEILKVVPNYMKRALTSMWGYGSSKKEDLEDYFSKHALPDENWSGWNEDVNLDDVRVKLIKKAGLDFSEFDVWDDQVAQANQTEIPLPKVNHRMDPAITASRLKALLTKQGLEDVRIEVARSGSRSRSTLKLVHDSRPDIEEALEDYELI